MLVLDAAQGLGFEGAMYDMVDASGSTSSPTLLGPCLVLDVSSKRMRGGTLVWIA
jgi:hypothetical protein